MDERAHDHGDQDNIQEGNVLTYFGTEVNRKYFAEMYIIFLKAVSAAEDEAAQLARFKKYMYEIYDAHRQEMLEKKQMDENSF